MKTLKSYLTIQKLQSLASKGRLPSLKSGRYYLHQINTIALVTLVSTIAATAQQTGRKAEHISSLVLEAVGEGGTVDLGVIQSHHATLFAFLDPECPLCQNYSLTLNKLYAEYTSADIPFYGIIPGEFTTREKVRAYMKKYDISFPVLLDPDYRLTEVMSATVTPEVVLVSGSEERLYQGAIDNWAYQLGKKRQVITEHYLQDALEAVRMGKAIPVGSTDAIGCFIHSEVDEK